MSWFSPPNLLTDFPTLGMEIMFFPLVKGHTRLFTSLTLYIQYNLKSGTLPECVRNSTTSHHFYYSHSGSNHQHLLPALLQQSLNWCPSSYFCLLIFYIQRSPRHSKSEQIKSRVKMLQWLPIPSRIRTKILTMTYQIMFHSPSDLTSSPLYLFTMLQSHWHWFPSSFSNRVLPQGLWTWCSFCLDQSSHNQHGSISLSSDLIQLTALILSGRSFLISLYNRATSFLIYFLCLSPCFIFLKKFYHCLTYYIITDDLSYPH